MTSFPEEYYRQSRYGRQPQDILRRNYAILLREHGRFTKGSGLRPSTVLDFGCGTGHGSRVIAEATGATVVGVDVSDYAIDVARGTMEDGNVRFLRRDLSAVGAGAALRGEVGSVGLVLSRDTLEHIPRPCHATVLANLAELLGPGGSITVQTPNRLHPLARLVDRTHVGLRSPRGWRRLFSAAFEDVAVRVTQFPPVLWRLPSVGYREFTLPLVGFNVYVHGRKGGG